jgi:hypothetical protein
MILVTAVVLLRPPPLLPCKVNVKADVHMHSVHAMLQRGICLDMHA